MRDRDAAWAARWRALGALLPRDVRERIFEPAFNDLLRRWLTDHRRASRLPFAWFALGTALGCLPVAVQRVFVANGALTRAGRVTVALLATLMVLVVVLQRLTRAAAGY